MFTQRWATDFISQAGGRQRVASGRCTASQGGRALPNRLLFCSTFSSLLASPAWSEGIADVLKRSTRLVV